MKYIVYVLKSLKDNKCYTGYTSDLDRRLIEHNSGKTKSLSRRRPLILVHKEEFIERAEAMRREKFLKSGQGRKYLNSLLNHPPEADAQNC